MKLIDKDALVAEIERKEKYAQTLGDNAINGSMQQFYDGMKECCQQLSVFLDTLEMKEVDLEKETDKYIFENFHGSETLGFFANRTKEEPNWKDIALCAKHFFELGLKAQKGESV